MAAGSAAIFFSSRMSPAAFTMHTLTVSRDTSRPAKYSIFLSLGCHIECQDSRLGPTARLLHLCRLGLDGKVPDHSTFSRTDPGAFARATCCAAFSRPSFSGAWRRVWSPPTDLRSTRVLSLRTPTSSARFQAASGRFAPRANILRLWTMRHLGRRRL